jgi:uncharacterized protein (TIGR02266 family)
MEKRESPRADAQFEVQYRTAQEFILAYSRNISGGGIFVRTTQPPPLNTEVRLRFTLPGVARLLELRGLVVWTNASVTGSAFPPGMGIKFLDLDPDGARLITEFVKGKISGSSFGERPTSG